MALLRDVVPEAVVESVKLKVSTACHILLSSGWVGSLNSMNSGREGEALITDGILSESFKANPMLNHSKPTPCARSPQQGQKNYDTIARRLDSTLDSKP